MNGLYFLGSIIAVFVVIIWFVRNDKVQGDEATTGLLAMKVPSADPTKDKKKKKRWTREGDGH